MGCTESRCHVDRELSTTSERPVNKPMGFSVKTIKSKYHMSMAKQDVLGEGTTAACYEGSDVLSGEKVAIKVYKSFSSAELKKVRNHVAVLKDLLTPFSSDVDNRHWCKQLAACSPTELFVRLIDYSQNKMGQPGFDAGDGHLYIVLERAEFSFKELIAHHRNNDLPLTMEISKSIARQIVLVAAGMHAKGFVHLDLKPENLMVFDGRLKLIDVDGCVRAGSVIWSGDTCISYSPCYCAPEWARWITDKSTSSITVKREMDVWSVGMTLGELATLDAVLRPKYKQIARQVSPSRRAGYAFLCWLGSLRCAPLPAEVSEYDLELHSLLIRELLVCEPSERKTLAECLSSSSYLSCSGKTEDRRITLPRAQEKKPFEIPAAAADKRLPTLLGRQNSL